MMVSEFREGLDGLGAFAFIFAAKMIDRLV